MKITNTTEGPKGIHDKHGALTMLDPGASADVDVDAKHVNDEWFGHGTKAAAEKADDKTA